MLLSCARRPASFGFVGLNQKDPWLGQARAWQTAHAPHAACSSSIGHHTAQLHQPIQLQWLIQQQSCGPAGLCRSSQYHSCKSCLLLLVALVPLLQCSRQADLHSVEVQVRLVGSGGYAGSCAAPHANAVRRAPNLDHQPALLGRGLGQVPVVDVAQAPTADKAENSRCVVESS